MSFGYEGNTIWTCVPKIWGAEICEGLKYVKVIVTVPSAGRPALISGIYICGLLLISCLVLNGLTSFSVFMSSAGRPAFIQ